jgi:hypothetical protein
LSSFFSFSCVIEGLESLTEGDFSVWVSFFISVFPDSDFGLFSLGSKDLISEILFPSLLWL